MARKRSASPERSLAEARSVKVRLGKRSYVIRIAEGLVDEVGPALRETLDPTGAIVVTDTNVRALYAERVQRSLARAGMKAATLEIPPGERSKSAKELARLWDGMLAHGLDRKGAIVALGGGVVGDIAGFAAATILRGVAFLQVPTTLLAQVDSSVGGKTGIDLDAGKNLAGAFWQPAGVLADPSTLRTLPPRELKAGLAEVVKTGVIRSKPLFDLCEKRAEAMLNCEPDALGEAVRRSCSVKARVVGRDERDTTGERAVLNFGHTVGHAVEAAAGLGSVLHGEAVSIGMVAAGRVALRLGFWDEGSQERLEKLLARFGLPVGLGGLDLDEGDVIRRLRSDKKAVAGDVYFVLPMKLGCAELHPEPVPEKLVREVVRGL
ncbi:MAG: 3-dehydroquinate synthase [Planctomycetota bacterium]